MRQIVLQIDECQLNIREPQLHSRNAPKNYTQDCIWTPQGALGGHHDLKDAIGELPSGDEEPNRMQ